MKLRSVILPLFLAGTLSSIYFLPSSGDVSLSAVNMDFPETEGSWHLKKIPASKEELEGLAEDTKFSKAECYSARPGEFSDDGKIIPDVLNLSVVLSGSDVNNSIHRPERCLVAQGHQLQGSSDKVIPLANGKTVTVKRLRSIQHIPTNKEGTEHIELNSLTYYFFVGHDRITNDHLERTFIDMKDRIIRGMDQRWAYVSTSMWYGKLPWMNGVEVSEEEADRKLAGFVEGFSEKQIDWDQITD